MSYNSTIQQKTGLCIDCNDGREKPITAGRCNNHYRTYRNLVSQQRVSQREAARENKTIEEKDLSDLIKDCDILYSRWLRMSSADKDGNCQCYTCGKTVSWKSIDCGHYISRRETFLRFDPRNTKPQCVSCNRMKDGNLSEYSQRLNKENPGITEILQEESNLVYKFTRDELRQMRTELSQKIDCLKLEKNF